MYFCPRSFLKFINHETSNKEGILSVVVMEFACSMTKIKR